MSLNAKLTIGALLIASATIYLAFLGASSSWRYYVHVDECAANREALAGNRLRVSGRVAPQSLRIQSGRSLATFTLNGTATKIAVSCRGPLPDNLAEDMDVVVEGTLEPNAKSGGDMQLRGEKVLTRCASKYQAEPK
jgi:cytochrome c-type biogenesis protein CcmE